MHMLLGPNGPRVLPFIVSAASEQAVFEARSCKPIGIGLAEAEQRPCRAWPDTHGGPGGHVAAVGGAGAAQRTSCQAIT